MRSIWFLLFALVSIICLSSFPVAYAEGSVDTEDYDDVGDDEDVEYVDEDEEVDGDDSEEDADDGDTDEDEDEEEEYVEEEEDDVLGPSEDVQCLSVLLNYPDKRIVVGEKVVVLMNFLNKGETNFNLTEVGAFLHSPFDFNYYMHNFTAKPLANAIVEPNTHFSVEYSFTPQVNLIDGSLEYTMSTYLLYNSTGDEPEEYKSTPFNKTVTLVEPPSTVDMKRFFTRFLIVAVIGLVIYIGIGVFNKQREEKSKLKKSMKPKTAKATSTVENTWEFKKYTQSKVLQKKSSKTRKKKMKKK